MALYVLPFLFVTYPGLLLQGDWTNIILDFVKAMLIMIYLPSAYMGILFGRATSPERLMFLLAIILLWVSQGSVWLNLAGYALAAVPAVSNYRRRAAEAD